MSTDKEITILRAEIDSLAAEITAVKLDMAETKAEVVALKEWIKTLLAKRQQ